MPKKELGGKNPRGVFIAGNWKMNHGREETRGFFSEVQKNWPFEKTPAPKGLKMALFAPPLSIDTAIQSAKSHSLAITIGAQNAHGERNGAFTGEISGPMLNEAGVNLVLLGHSERRQFFGETSDSVRKRAKGLLNQGFNVLFCVGETREQREAKQTGQILMDQLSRGLPDPSEVSSPFLNGRFMIAYEPVWAIGTGLTATPEQAEEAHSIIRQYLETKLGASASENTPILYGGSVTPDNLEILLKCPNVDGALVGGASLKPSSFLQLVKIAARSMGE